jgi:cytidylate kinase
MFPVWGGPRSPTSPPLSEFPPKSDNPSGVRGPSPENAFRLLCSPPVNSLIVTVDGPGGTGKSTVSRAVAEKAGLPHLDTGAFYRAATLAVLEAGVDPASGALVTPVVASLDMSQENGRMFLDGRDVTDEIRGEAVTAAVSAVSAHPEVRAILVEEQRAWVKKHGRRAVVEGRDIGSVVFPDAEVKVFLDASARVRAQRRAKETGETLEEVLEDLNRRDRLDSTRATSPMTVPDGAVVVDTSDLSFDQVVEQMLALVTAKS